MPAFYRYASCFRLGVVLLALASSTPQARPVILFRTGDPTANTMAPTGVFAGSGWGFEGTFGDYLGTVIGPHFFITAQHIGSQPAFTFRGTNYTPVRSYDDPGSDLRIYEVSETFPEYAPLYSGSNEVAAHIVVIGRGTQRGPAHYVNGQLVGWDWGNGDKVQRWGENQVTKITTNNGRDFLYVTFDQNGLPEEAHISGGDSGGGVFINDSGVWKLAGVNYDVDTFSSSSKGGGDYNAALFDERGTYDANGALISGPAPVPSGFYATRISSRFDWILSVIAPHFANISSRASVQINDQVCIAGFIIAGAADQTKRILVRALGPSLTANGRAVANRLSDPFLELHDAGGAVLMNNDDWQSAQRSEIEQSGLAPSESHESAMIATLSPGTYTAILRGANGSTGTGLLEVYDLDPNETTALANLSTRAPVGTGDDVLVGGFIARSASANILLRALGPELSGRGVENPMADPTLEVHDANGLLVSSNNDWRNSSSAAQISATGLGPTNTREAAILMVAPGTNSYTAILRGANNTTAVALLEAYVVK